MDVERREKEALLVEMRVGLERESESAIECTASEVWMERARREHKPNMRAQRCSPAERLNGRIYQVINYYKCGFFFKIFVFPWFAISFLFWIIDVLCHELIIYSNLHPCSLVNC